MSSIAFCDMDGVLTDFIGGAARLQGKEAPVRGGPPCSRCVEKLYGASTWHLIRGAGPDFWRLLQPYPWAVRLWAMLDGRAQGGARVLSDPGRHGIIQNTGHAKHVWCRQHLEIDIDRVILTGGKSAVARRGAALIDDKESNVDAWIAAGGIGVLLPQPWNRDHALCGEDPVEYVAHQLDLHEF